MDSAFQWIEQNNGLCLESDYPYVSGTTKKSGSCEESCAIISKSAIHDYKDVTPNSDNAMMTALMQQPVSIAIQADQKEFQLYQSGVFTGSCGTELDHGVLVVGYGTENGEDYYSDCWSESVFETTRSFDNLYFNEKKELLNKLDFFLQNKDWYYKKGIPR